MRQELTRILPTMKSGFTQIVLVVTALIVLFGAIITTLHLTERQRLLQEVQDVRMAAAVQAVSALGAVQLSQNGRVSLSGVGEGVGPNGLHFTELSGIGADPLAKQAAIAEAAVIDMGTNAVGLAVPIWQDGHVIGVAHVDLPVEVPGAAIGSSFWPMLTLELLAVTVALSISLWFGQRYIRPMRQLDAAMRAVASGDLNPVLPSGNSPEMQGFSAHFGLMLDALRNSMNQMNHVAYRDALTGLPNRAWFSGYLGQVLDSVNRDEEQAVLMFLDVDRFKQINDTLGHEVGDLLLIQFSARLSDALGAQGWQDVSGDLPAPPDRRPHEREAALARLGGDEFTVVLRGCDDRRAARALAEEINRTMAIPFELGEERVHASTSIGIAMLPQDGRSSRDALKSADMAMYRSKQAGRGTFRFFDQQEPRTANDSTQMRRDLIAGLERGEFVVDYQPRFDLRTQKVVGAEAFLRWEHPKLGRLGPADFLPHAWAVQLRSQLTLTVLRQTLANATRWPDVDGRPLTLSLNLSEEELRDGEVVEAIIAEMKTDEAEWVRLELEISEEAVMRADPVARLALRRLRLAGLSLAVDGFGSGFSNLARLKDLQFGRLKTEPSLVRNLGKDASADALFNSILEMGQAVGIEVVAAGIETSGQLAHVTKLGCQGGQGYGLARPMQQREFLAFLAHQERRLAS